MSNDSKETFQLLHEFIEDKSWWKQALTVTNNDNDTPIHEAFKTDANETMQLIIDAINDDNWLKSVLAYNNREVNILYYAYIFCCFYIFIQYREKHQYIQQ